MLEVLVEKIFEPAEVLRIDAIQIEVLVVLLLFEGAGVR